MCSIGRVWTSARWTAFTRASGACISIRMSVWTAERVSRCAQVEAIFSEDDLPESCGHIEPITQDFFTQVLPGRAAPLGSPGGAAKLGPLGVDTPLVAGLPPAGLMSAGRRRDVLAVLRARTRR